MPAASKLSKWTAYVLFPGFRLALWVLLGLATTSAAFAQGCMPNGSGDPAHPFNATLWNSAVTEKSNADCDTVLIADPSTRYSSSSYSKVVILIHGICLEVTGCFDAILTDPTTTSAASSTPPGASLDTYFQYLIPALAQANQHASQIKIYRFQYRSNLHSVPEIAASFRNWIDYLNADPAQAIGYQYSFIAHSMGGLVARSYMNEQTHQTLRGPEPGGDRVSQLITLATPHHGTPLANGSARVPGWESDWNWLAAQLDAMVWNSPSQGSTLSSLQSNRADLRWDDVYPINWPGKYDGTVETNSWLAGVPHTYDYKDRKS